MASFCCLCYKLWTDFTHCSGVSIVEFEQGNADWNGTKIHGEFVALMNSIHC